MDAISLCQLLPVYKANYLDRSKNEICLRGIVSDKSVFTAT